MIPSTNSSLPRLRASRSPRVASTSGVFEAGHVDVLAAPSMEPDRQGGVVQVVLGVRRIRDNLASIVAKIYGLGLDAIARILRSR